jgi:hypothetical protein
MMNEKPGPEEQSLRKIGIVPSLLTWLSCGFLWPIVTRWMSVRVAGGERALHGFLDVLVSLVGRSLLALAGGLLYDGQDNRHCEGSCAGN